jgi:hypothetical protein
VPKKYALCEACDAKGPVGEKYDNENCEDGKYNIIETQGE